MIYKFRIISSEEKGFVRDMEMRSDQTFYDFHQFLTKNLHYDNSQLASFFISNQNWEKELEISLFDLSEGSSENIMIMDKTIIHDLIKDTQQRLLYVFDFFNERLLFIEVVDSSELQPGVKYPRITRSEGHPPPQILIIDTNFEDLDDE